ncbi:MAG: tetratricopeptide repeat protein [Spirochaetota bacterium]
MSQQEKLGARERFVNWLSSTLSRYRKVVMIGGISLIVIVVGIVVFFQVQERRLQESVVMVENAEELISEWEQSQEEDRSEIESEFMSLLDDVIDGYSNLYSAQRALFLRARFYMETEQWSEAVADYRSLTDSFPESHLALISLSNKATAHEELGESDQALETYEELSELRETRNPMRARALFSIGRLQEQSGETDDALESYEGLVSEYPNSDWTNLARNRILAIETGHAGG